MPWVGRQVHRGAKYISLVAAIAVVIAVGGFLTWFTATGGTAYFYALCLENRWSKADPKTKSELEGYLHLYSLVQIDPKTSLWGRSYVLQEGERMMQYRLLWDKKCPLDVVYDKQNNIKAIFTSYE
jgi:hypothetical protein